MRINTNISYLQSSKYLVVGRFSIIEGPKTDILSLGDVLDIKTLKYKDTVSSPFYPGDNVV